MIDLQFGYSENEMLDAALELYEQGFHIIPLGSPAESAPFWFTQRFDSQQEANRAWPKAPRIKWKEYQSKAPTEQLIRQWWGQWPKANIGILTGSVIVVDADDQNAVEYMESGDVIRTPWKVKTGNGVHYYYQKNPKVEIHNSVDATAKLDIRGYGGYVVAPPSRHQNGSIYTWEQSFEFADSVIELPVLNNSDLEKIKRFNHVPGNLSHIDLTNIKTTATEIPVKKGERNNAAASLAGKYIAQGIALDEVKRRVQAWNVNNPDPLSVDEVNRTCESVQQTHNFNHKKLAEEIKPQIDCYVDIATAITQPLEVKFLVESFIQEGRAYQLHGPWKAGKSVLALDFSLHLSQGKNWANKRTIQSLVIYVAGEAHQDIIARIKGFQKEFGLDLKNTLFQLRTRPVYFTQEQYARQLYLEIEHFRTLNPGVPVLVVVDTLARNFGPGSESNDEDMGAFTDHIIDIVMRPTNATCLIVHHPGHMNQERGRGSSKFPAGVDGTFRLERNDDIVTLNNVDMRNLPVSNELNFRLCSTTTGDKDNFGNEITVPFVKFEADYKPPQISYPSGHLGELMRIAQRLANAQAEQLEQSGYVVPKQVVVYIKDVLEKFKAEKASISPEAFKKAVARNKEELIKKYPGAAPDLLVTVQLLIDL